MSTIFCTMFRVHTTDMCRLCIFFLSNIKLKMNLIFVACLQFVLCHSFCWVLSPDINLKNCVVSIIFTKLSNKIDCTVRYQYPRFSIVQYCDIHKSSCSLSNSILLGKRFNLYMKYASQTNGSTSRSKLSFVLSNVLVVLLGHYVSMQI